MWGPAPAVNPMAKQQQQQQQQQMRAAQPAAGSYNNNNASQEGLQDASRRQKGKKGKMQKIDASSLLGFTVHAGERVNIGQIDSIE